MKPYGYNAKERKSCAFGCCLEHPKTAKHISCRKKLDKERRKAARRTIDQLEEGHTMSHMITQFDGADLELRMIAHSMFSDDY